MDYSKLLGIFSRGNQQLPPGVAKLLRRTDKPEKVLLGIDTLLAENQVKLKKLKREFTTLEFNEREEKKKIEAGGLSERAENFVLDNLSRLDMRLKSIEGEMGVLSTNINMLTMLEGKVKEGQAMALSGFSEEQIEEILLDHGERKETYQQKVGVTDLSDEYDPLQAQRDARREQMKAKIIADKLARESPEKGETEAIESESVVKESVVKESVVKETVAEETAAEESEQPKQARKESAPRKLEME